MAVPCMWVSLFTWPYFLEALLSSTFLTSYFVDAEVCLNAFGECCLAAAAAAATDEKWCLLTVVAVSLHVGWVVVVAAGPCH